MARERNTHGNIAYELRLSKGLILNSSKPSAIVVFFQPLRYWLAILFFKGKIDSSKNTQKTDQVFPVKGLFQIKNSKESKDDERHYFLDNF